MSTHKLKYKTKTATKEEIYLHLKECNNNFIPALDQKVSVKDYSEKIAEKAVTFEAWADNILVGLVAAYFNDSENRVGYITNVSITMNQSGKGIASELINRCMKYARQKNFKEIKLEVFKNNNKAIQLYKKLNFTSVEIKNDMVQMQQDLNNS
ncbi:MAG: GNAT family N-acetyltransferase [Bacteroidetes bacterium]|nr:GNAT family N-acetyltransferase [Bacteroidota bacterium]